MSLSIIQKPTPSPFYKLYEVNRPVIYSVKESATGSMFNHKYVAYIYIGTTNNPHTYATPIILKVTPNVNDVGIFDISSIVQSYVGPQFVPSDDATLSLSSYDRDNRFSIHEIDRFSRNTGTIKYCSVEFFNYYSSTVDGIPAIDTSFLLTSDVIRITNGVLDVTDRLSLHNYESIYYYDEKGVTRFSNTIEYDTSNVLTEATTNQEIGTNEYHTVSFYNGVKANDDYGLASTFFRFYPEPDAQGSMITSFGINHTSGHGGASTNTGTVNDSTQEQIFAGVGTANLTNAGQTIPSNWNSYKVQFVTHTGVIGMNQIIFNRRYDCIDYEVIRLCWINKYGAWDYYSYPLRNVRTTKYKRSTYRPVHGDWSNSLGYEMLPHHGGEQVFNINNEEELTLQTNYITQAEATFLSRVYSSPFVGIISDNGVDSTRQGRFELVTVLDNTFIKKTTANDDIIQYTLKIKKSKNNYTHRV